MTFIEMIYALLITGFFLTGFSQISIPAYKSWEKAVKRYQTAQTINFIAESFKNECSEPDRNIERWQKTVSAAKELESCEFYEYWQDKNLRAIKLTCIISGEKFEIIGLCSVETSGPLVHGLKITGGLQ